MEYLSELAGQSPLIAAGVALILGILSTST